MKLLPSIIVRLFENLLLKPGDTFHAEVTQTGRQVVKSNTEEMKHSITRYPTTGTIVETKTYKSKK